MTCSTTIVYSNTCRYDLTCTSGVGGVVTQKPERVIEYRDYYNQSIVCNTTYSCGC